MKKFLVSFFFEILFFLTLPKVAHAQVVINEFSSYSASDWVELINLGNESVDLSTYRIRDSLDNSETNKIDLSGSIAPDEIKAFDFTLNDNSLNKDNDVVRLFLISGEQEILKDSIEYKDSGFDHVCASEADNETIARIPDGGNTIDRLSAGTKGATNGVVATDPCPTPTPNPTATSIPSPTQTNTPTNTATPKPTATIKPTSTSTQTPTIKEPSLTVTPNDKTDAEKEFEKLSDNSDSEPMVLGASGTENVENPKNNSSFRKTLPKDIIPYALIGFGVLLTGYSGYVFWRLKKNND